MPASVFSAVASETPRPPWCWDISWPGRARLLTPACVHCNLTASVPGSLAGSGEGSPGRAWRTAPGRRPGARARGPPRSRSWCAACAPAPPGPSGSACPSCSCWGPSRGKLRRMQTHVTGAPHTAKHAASAARAAPIGSSRNIVSPTWLGLHLVML